MSPIRAGSRLREQASDAEATRLARGTVGSDGGLHPVGPDLELAAGAGRVLMETGH